MNTELKNTIDAQREILSTLPKNNVRNKNKYYKKIDELYENYNNLFIETTQEIKKRNENIIGRIRNFDDCKENVESINEIKKDFYLFNKYNTSYEKLGFDKLLYSLSINDNNLRTVNEIIYDSISIFKKIGIVLEPENFKYSPVAYLYMKYYFKYINNLEENELKEQFEKLYWKFPNIITHIELTFKNLYFKYKKSFDKYMELEKEKVIKKNGKNLLEIYKQKKINYDLCARKNISKVFNQFVTRDLNPDDFSEIKIKQLVSTYVDSDYFDNNYDLVIDNFYKLYNTLTEYKNYLEYSFIVEDMKKLYSEKDKYKDAFKNKYKEILKEEKNLNKKVKKYYLFAKKNNKEEILDKLNMEIDVIVVNLKKLYDSLEEDKFNENLLKLSDNSELVSLLELANSYYIYFVKCLENNEENYDISKGIESLNDLLISPYNTLINNVNIGDVRDINIIIRDLYKLSNIKINEESISDVSSIESILTSLDKIFKFDLLMKNNISLEELIFVYKVSGLF